MTDTSKSLTDTERIMGLLQDIENDRRGDLVTGFVLIAKKVPSDYPDHTAWMHFYRGSIDERLGLIDMAQTSTRNQVGRTEGDV